MTTADRTARRYHHQRHLACPARADGHTAAGIPGDCLRTAAATVVGAKPHTLTHYALFADWWGAMRREARERWGHDWAYIDHVLTHQGDAGWTLPPGALYALGSGPSPRGPFAHVVVVELTAHGPDPGDPITIRQAHDPHPLGAGLTTVDNLLIACAPYDPAPTLRALPASRP